MFCSRVTRLFTLLLYLAYIYTMSEQNFRNEILVQNSPMSKDNSPETYAERASKLLYTSREAPDFNILELFVCTSLTLV